MWRRLWMAWACVAALVFAAGTASAASSAPAKPHQGTSEFSAALNVCAFTLATAQVHTGNRCLPKADTSDVPDAARGTQAGANAFHHTVEGAVESISRTGLRPGSYATPTSGLSPLQAHIELALNPAGGARNAVLQIDVAGLRAAGYEIPSVTRVTGQFGMPGGGFEMRFPYAIPPEFIKVLP